MVAGGVGEGAEEAVDPDQPGPEQVRVVDVRRLPRVVGEVPRRLHPQLIEHPARGLIAGMRVPIRQRGLVAMMAVGDDERLGGQRRHEARTRVEVEDVAAADQAHDDQHGGGVGQGREVVRALRARGIAGVILMQFLKRWIWFETVAAS